MCGAGEGIPALLTLLRSGQTAIRPVTRFPVSGPPIGALVETPPMPTREDDPDAHQRLALEFGLKAGLEALGDVDPEPCGLVVGTNLEDRPRFLDALTADLAGQLGVRGPQVTCSTACASSATAIGHALRLLDRGVPRVLVGGLDVVTPRLYAGFHRLGALSAEPSAPFSTRLGISLGDGAAFVLLERRHGSGGPSILGWATRADAHHPTAPSPDGRGVRAALTRALERAGQPDISWVSAHGTGTEANDAAEWRGVVRVLGEVPCSAPKSQLGHTQGAAGMLELITALLAQEHQFLPASVGPSEPRPGAPEDRVLQVRPAVVGAVASISCGFGGVCTAVVLGEGAEVPAPPRPVVRHAVGRVASDERLAIPDLAAELRGIDPRETDPTTCWILAAIRRAWREGGRPSRADRLQTGLIVSQRCTSPTRVQAMESRVRGQGLDAMGAVHFSRCVPVVPAGACSMHLGLQGPLDVLLGDPDEALDHGRWLLERDPGLRGMLVVHAREWEPDHPDEGAIAIWLQPGVPGDTRQVIEQGMRFIDAC